MSYRDPHGLLHHALQGENVDVHPDHLADFDKANDPEGTHTPKKAAPKTKSARKT